MARRLLLRILLRLLLLLCTLTVRFTSTLFAADEAADSKVQANAKLGEWRDWRGPRRDGVSDETGLLTEWPENGPPLQWQASGLGSGYSSVVVADGRIYTMGLRDGEQQDGKCSLLALNVADGKELWAMPVDVHSPNSTPNADGDLVYALGLKGKLVAVEAETGEERWSAHLADDFGGKTQTDIGFSETPLVDGPRLICTPGGKDAALVAFDKRSGVVLWKAALPGDVGSAGADGAGYSSVVVSEACGVRQYVALVGRGVIGVAADNGKVLWTYNRVANEHANVATPIVRGDYAFCSTAYGAGAVLLRVEPEGADANGLRCDEVYFLKPKVLQNHHGGLVLVGDHVYTGHGHNNGFPLCVEFETGKIAWRPGRGPGTGSAAILYADGHLYFRYENGVMALIEANPREYVLKSTFKIPNPAKSWSHPVIAGGRLYLREQGELYCYELREKARP